MEAVFLHILNIAITASWLVLAVVLLRFVLKKAPKWATCLLWGIVALRLILPFSLESALSLIPNTEPIPESIIVTGTPTVNSGLEGVDQVPGQVPDQVPGEVPGEVPNQVPNQVPGQVEDSVISGSLATTPGDSVDPVQVLVFAASIVWIAGIVLMLGYGAFSYLRLKRKVRTSLCKEGRVYLCDNIDTPFILGVFRPRIYLPSGMADSEIPYVIAHEEAHLKRKDHLWKPLGFLLLAVYWFNPLLWVGYILLCRDIENACDEKAIKDSDTAYKVSYSEALLACSIHRRTVMACPLAFGEVGVKSRIRAVLHYKKPAFWVILVAILVLIVTCVCFLTDPVSEKDETTTAPSTTETPVTTTLQSANTPSTTKTTPTTTAPTTPENPDAWKEKVDWESVNQGYLSEIDKYQIRIVVADIQGVGQKNADAAFAEKHELFYRENVYYMDYYPFDLEVPVEDIEKYAKLDEVKTIFSPRFKGSEPPIDAWKNKITWFNRDCWYDAERDKYKIRITVSDVHNVGQASAEEAFAKKYGLEYRPHWIPYYFEIWASIEEIELFAWYVDVEKIYFPPNPNDPIPTWKKKVQWINDDDYSSGAYNAETGRFSIVIYIKDIHHVGQTNAEAAFAEKYGLDYERGGFHGEATKEEIEMYARLEEVSVIWFDVGNLEIPFG